ncbi:chromatin modification-related protein eaf-1 [Rhypophila decipiens]|uniref:Chromatin modification-related protein eaf-1 n=1 Tax=Rhypophila decipiens TaxID=261697 RepID=A0AAN7BB16_9PEZI|nr:chromatin modification-related protein eaf-1 [Rhypophila decipiens]
MTEVGPADRVKQLRSYRAESSSILTSRKRKLRELFAVAADQDGIPNFDFSDPDAQPKAEAEAKFLFECDILQGRRLNEVGLPRVRKPRFDKILLSPELPTENSTPAKSNRTVQVDASARVSETNRLPTTSESTTDTQDGPRLGQNDKVAGISEKTEFPGAVTTPAPLSPREQLSQQHANSQPSAHRTNEEPAREPHQNASQLPARVESLPSSKPESTQATSLINGVIPEVDAIPGTLDQPGGKETDTTLDGRISHGEGSRYPDALSSPGSTAHSTLTPAVHDVSTDTSPDNEGPQYIERTEEDLGDKEIGGNAEDKVDGTLQAEATSPGRDSLPTAMSGVEAQLLQESAAAQVSRFGSVEDHLTSSADGNVADLQTLGLQSQNLPARNVVHGQQQDVTIQHETSNNASTIPPQQPAPSKAGVILDIHHGGSSIPMDVDASSVPVTGDIENEKQRPTVPTIMVEPPSQEHAQEANRPSVQPPRVGATPAFTNEVPEVIISTEQEPSTPEPERTQLPHLDFSIEKQVNDTSAQPLSASQLKLLANNLRQNRQKRRRSVPTVIFGKPTKKPRVSDDTALVAKKAKPGGIPTDDYFTPLFIEGFTRTSTWMKPIEKLLNQAHKTVSTTDQYVSILDHQSCKILRRVYHLQQYDKWSLRQPVRCPEPIRPASHWDVVLQEMKWMRTDFREERKWKHAVAKNLAYDCAEWVHSGPVERLALQVNAKIPPLPVASDADIEMSDCMDASLPELVHSDSPGEHDDEPIEVLVETVAPSMIFAFQNDEVIFGLQHSKAADQLLENLPMYGSPLKVPKFDLAAPDYDPDASWKRPALPLSKYVEGEMVLAAKPPPRKRSRYEYAAESEGEDEEEVIFGDVPARDTVSKPENTSVALFSDEMKITRDRLHAGHQFRPPTDYPMPLQSFYESRTASQFASGAERRTPWECFERWVSLVGLPNDMAKTPYFKTYQSRIDAAQRVILQQNNTAQQHVGPNGAVTPVPKKRPTTTVRVDRRRSQKHLALIDAMRKLAKKREAAAQKAAQAATMASNRKVNEAPRQQVQNKTPRDYSIMRWERDQQLAEKMALYAQRHQEALQKRAMAQRQSHAGQASGTPGALPTAERMASATPLNNVARLNIPAHLAVPMQTQPQNRVQVQPPSVAVPAVPAQLPGGLVPPMQMGAIQQAQLQALQAQRISSMAAQPNMNTFMQAKLIEQQQRSVLQHQQQHQHQQHPHPHQQQHHQQHPSQQQAQQQPQQQKPQPQHSSSKQHNRLR